MTTHKQDNHFKEHFFTVNGCGPIGDMLRYDRCCPATEEDGHKLDRAIAGRRAETIRMVRFYPVGGRRGPNVDRWRSFAWSVTE
jgi:hypothetical protein